MTRHEVLLKVYGHIYPADAALYAAVQRECRALVDCPLESAVELCGDLLRISYEGLYFPLDEVLEALPAHLSPDSQGKIDYIDLENWTLTRCTVKGQSLQRRSVPLNSVLDYSGH